MHPEQFLQPDLLRTDGACEAQMLAVAGDHVLHEAFEIFEGSPSAAALDLVHRCVAQIAVVLGDKPPAETGMRKQTLRKMHFQLTKWDHAKVREALALAHAVGALTEPERLHVHDVCGGKGQVAVFVAFVRKQLGLDTDGICWELQEDQVRGHERIKRWLWYPDAPVEFRPADIAGAELLAHDTEPTVCMGKHTCGPLADIILSKVRAAPAAEQPDATAVMTCCHALLTGAEDFWPAELPHAVRLAIAHAADPHRDASHDAYTRDVLAVSCRRFIDALRAKHYGGEAFEVLPYGHASNRNNVVRIRRGGVTG